MAPGNEFEDSNNPNESYAILESITIQATPLSAGGASYRNLRFGITAPCEGSAYYTNSIDRVSQVDYSTSEIFGKQVDVGDAIHLASEGFTDNFSCKQEIYGFAQAWMVNNKDTSGPLAKYIPGMVGYAAFQCKNTTSSNMYKVDVSNQSESECKKILRDFTFADISGKNLRKIDSNEDFTYNDPDGFAITNTLKRQNEFPYMYFFFHEIGFFKVSKEFGSNLERRSFDNWLPGLDVWIDSCGVDGCSLNCQNPSGDDVDACKLFEQNALGDFTIAETKDKLLPGFSYPTPNQKFNP